MELVEGKTLDECIPAGGMDLEQFFEIVIPLADALSAAHQRNITHRDLKPGNVMVTDDGRIKILDFGLAKLHQDDDKKDDNVTQSITQMGVAIGTVPYMSPEQLQGQAVDSRTDLFSLGVMFHEMVTSKAPFQGATSAELVSSIMRDRPRAVTEIKADLPKQLSRIIGRCLEKGSGPTFPNGARSQERVDRVAAGSACLGGGVRPFGGGAPVRRLESREGSGLLLRRHRGGADQRPGQNREPACRLRAASFQLKEAGADIGEIGSQLQVATVLGGSVRKAGNRLRVTAQLTNVADSSTMWSERYDREMKDVFAIQDEIAENITKALEVTLSPRERRAIQSVATRDVEAYDYYLRGRKFFYKLDRKSFEHAREMYSRAIEIDPAYALAYAGIADWLSAPSSICMRPRARKTAIRRTRRAGKPWTSIPTWQRPTHRAAFRFH